MKYLVYISAILVLFSCKKEEEPLAVIGNPDFYLQGSINGIQERIVAGDDNYYMYTSVVSGEDHVTQLQGSLKKEDCNKCGPSFSVLVRDVAGGDGNAKVLERPKLDYAISNAITSYKVRFNSEETFTSRAVNVDYYWDFGDGTSSTEKDPTHLFSSAKAFYDVCLTVETSKGVSSKLCNRIYMQTHCKTDFRLMQIGHQFELQSYFYGANAKLYHWEFGDDFSASTAKIDYDVNQNKAIEKICLTITDANGVKSQKCKNLVIHEDIAFTAANFNFEIEKILPKNGLLQNATVTVSYTDAYGEKYYSNSTLNATNSFKILDLEEYKKNENGDAVKRIHVLMDTQLQSASGKTLTFDAVEGYLGVAYDSN